MTEIVTWFPQAFAKQANWYAVRYGAPVYLVGSALESANPRDIDVRIILTWPEIDRLFGMKIADEFTRGHWRMLQAQLKHSRVLRTWGGYPIDLQFQCPEEAVAFKDKKRIRLDDAPDWVLSAGLPKEG